MNIIDVTAASDGNIPEYGNGQRYIAVHYLGVVGQNNKIDAGGYGAHFYIYWDGTVYQAAPLNAVLWQVGTAGYYTQKHPMLTIIMLLESKCVQSVMGMLLMQRIHIGILPRKLKIHALNL